MVKKELPGVYDVVVYLGVLVAPTDAVVDVRYGLG
jgi:hypothetical protein